MSPESSLERSRRIQNWFASAHLVLLLSSLGSAANSISSAAQDLEMPSSEITTGGGQVKYALTLGLGKNPRVLCDYDPFAASFLLQTINNGDWRFTLDVAPCAERCVDDVPVRKIALGNGHRSAASAVGHPVSDVLWDVLNISAYRWSCNPSVGYVGYFRPTPDEADVFISRCSFRALPDVTAGHLWDHLGKIIVRHEAKRSAMKRRLEGKTAHLAPIAKLEERFARVCCELTTLAEKLNPTPDLPLAELLFPGSSANVEVCTQYESDGNTTSFIGATETHTFSLYFVTS